MFFLLVLFHTMQMTTEHHVGGMQAPLQIHNLNLDKRKHLNPLPRFFWTVFWGLLVSDDPETLPRSGFELGLVFSSKLVKSAEEQKPNCDDIFSLCPLFILYTKGHELQWKRDHRGRRMDKGGTNCRWQKHKEEKHKFCVTKVIEKCHVHPVVISCLLYLKWVCL